MKTLKTISGFVAFFLALTVVIVFMPDVESVWDGIVMITFLTLWVYFAVKFSYVLKTTWDWIKKKVRKNNVNGKAKKDL